MLFHAGTILTYNDGMAMARYIYNDFDYVEPTLSTIHCATSPSAQIVTYFTHSVGILKE